MSITVGTSQNIKSMEDAVQALIEVRQNINFTDIERVAQVKHRAEALKKTQEEDITKLSAQNSTLKQEHDDVLVALQTLQLSDNGQRQRGNNDSADNAEDKRLDLEIEEYTEKIEALRASIDDMNSDMDKGLEEIARLKTVKEDIVLTKQRNNDNYSKLQIYKMLGLLLDSENMDLYIKEDEVINIQEILNLPENSRSEKREEIWNLISGTQEI
ncbi:hypothetical protein ACO0RG_001813 [Hanseniaspora osmophila]